MIAFNPDWGGQETIQDTPPYDGMVIHFLPSAVSDVLGSVPQLEAESSVKSFMQAQYRAAAENMRDSGLVYSSAI